MGNDGRPNRRLARFRVGIEVRSLGRGGLEGVVAQLVRGLPTEAIEPIVFCTEAGGETADELRREGALVEVLSAADRATEIEVLLREHGIDLLNTHFSTLGSAPAARLGIPVVATLHNSYAWLGRAAWDDFRTAARHVTAWIAVSEGVADFCARRFAIDRERIEVVPNGARFARVRDTIVDRRRRRERLGVASEAEFILQVGAVCRVKSQLALVDAVETLRHQRPGLVAWMVGPTVEADYAETVRRRIAEAGLDGRVVLAGPRDDIVDLLGAADAFVLPSVIEGSSLAALEALGSGVPVVLTRTGDAVELLGESPERAGDAPAKLAGVLVDGPALDPWNVDADRLREIAGAEHPAHAPALARALAEVLDDLPARRAAAVSRAAELAGTRSPETMCRRTANFLLRVGAAASAERARGLEAELARERRTIDDLRRTDAEVRALAGRIAGVESSVGGVAARLGGVESEVLTVSRTASSTLVVANRALEKLRLTARVKGAWQGWAGRLGARTNATPTPLPSPRPTREGAPPPTAPTTAAGPVVPRPRAAARPSIAPGPRGEHWLLLAVVPYDDIGGAQRSAQLARALAARGVGVSYAARFPRSESVDLGIRPDVPGLAILPWSEVGLQAWLRERDERVRVLVEVPDAQALAIARTAREVGARVIYDKVDAWEACTWATWFDPEVERRLVDLSDDLVASARLLQRGLAAGGRPVALVPNAVDRRLFDPDSECARSVPADLERGARTLVYAGSLWGDWFDWDIVAGTAAARPDWRINLVGDPPAERRADLPGNVRFLGLKPQGDLPAYYAASDACLIPFTPGPVVDAVSPLKVFEYLSMRRPVVATPMPELAGLPHVFTAADAAATVAAVERACATPVPTDAIEAFLGRNTWAVRAEALSGLGARPAISVIVLCYDNADVIGNCIRSLVRHRGSSGYEILVVDNGSHDGSLEILAHHERDGEIRLLRNVRNGCSSGRNLGVRESAGEIVVFLDSDQWAEREGWLDPALDALRAHRDIGAVAWNAGWFAPGTGGGPIVDDFPDRAMTGEHAGRPFRTDVAYLATSGFVVPRSVLARTQGFDEVFDPTCFEDTDLSFQVKAAGYRIAYCPAMALGHRPHQTTGALESYKSVRSRNEHYFLEKWRAHPEFFLTKP